MIDQVLETPNTVHIMNPFRFAPAGLPWVHRWVHDQRTGLSVDDTFTDQAGSTDLTITGSGVATEVYDGYDVIYGTVGSARTVVDIADLDLDVTSGGDDFSLILFAGVESVWGSSVLTDATASRPFKSAHNATAVGAYTSTGGFNTITTTGVNPNEELVALAFCRDGATETFKVAWSGTDADTLTGAYSTADATATLIRFNFSSYCRWHSCGLIDREITEAELMAFFSDPS